MGAKLFDVLCVLPKSRGSKTQGGTTQGQNSLMSYAFCQIPGRQNARWYDTGAKLVDVFCVLPKSRGGKTQGGTTREQDSLMSFAFCQIPGRQNEKSLLWANRSQRLVRFAKIPGPKTNVFFLDTKQTGRSHVPLTVFAGDDFPQAGYDFPCCAAQQEFIKISLISRF